MSGELLQSHQRVRAIFFWLQFRPEVHFASPYVVRAGRNFLCGYSARLAHGSSMSATPEPESSQELNPVPPLDSSQLPSRPMGEIPQMSFHLPPGMLPPIDQHEVAEYMFHRYCGEEGLMVMSKAVCRNLASTYEEVLKKAYLAAYEEEEPTGDVTQEKEEPLFTLRVVNAAVAPTGETTLLVTIEDEETGNFVLPCRTNVDGNFVCMLEGGTPQFQGLLLTIAKSERPSPDELHVRFNEEFLLPAMTTVTELSRLSNADWRTPLSSLFRQILSCYDDSIDEIQIVKTARDQLFPPSTMRFLLRTPKGEYLVGLGDVEGVGRVRVQFGFLFEPPLTVESSPALGSHRENESIISVVQARAAAAGDVLLSTDAAKEQYHCERVKELITNHLFDRSNGIWDTNWEVSLHAMRVTPDGTIRCIAALEDAEGKYHVPWLGSHAVDRSITSDEFQGIAVQVTLPESLRRGKICAAESGSEAPAAREDGEQQEVVEQILSHAYITESAMDRELRRLSHRQVSSVPRAEVENEREAIVVPAEPSPHARKGVFFPDLESTIQEHLVAMGCITPEQAGAVGLRNIRFAVGRKVDVGSEFEVDLYLVLAEHDWGTHVIKFERVNQIGGVPFEDAASVFGYFPKSFYQLREDTSELAVE